MIENKISTLTANFLRISTFLEKFRESGKIILETFTQNILYIYYFKDGPNYGLEKEDSSSVSRSLLKKCQFMEVDVTAADSFLY